MALQRNSKTTLTNKITFVRVLKIVFMFFKMYLCIHMCVFFAHMFISSTFGLGLGMAPQRNSKTTLTKEITFVRVFKILKMYFCMYVRVFTQIFISFTFGPCRLFCFKCGHFLKSDNDIYFLK